jgi:predicted RNA-binding protein YlxR (DUF448 family)
VSLQPCIVLFKNSGRLNNSLNYVYFLRFTSQEFFQTVKVNSLCLQMMSNVMNPTKRKIHDDQQTANKSMRRGYNSNPGIVTDTNAQTPAYDEKKPGNGAWILPDIKFNQQLLKKGLFLAASEDKYIKENHAGSNVWSRVKYNKTTKLLRSSLLTRQVQADKTDEISLTELAKSYAVIGIQHPGIWQRWGETTFLNKAMSVGAIAFTPIKTLDKIYEASSRGEKGKAVEVLMPYTYEYLLYNANRVYQNMMLRSDMPETTKEFPGPLIQSAAIYDDLALNQRYRVWVFYFHPIRKQSILQIMQFQSDEEDADTRGGVLHTLKNSEVDVIPLTKPDVVQRQVSLNFVDNRLITVPPAPNHGGGGGGGRKEDDVVEAEAEAENSGNIYQPEPGSQNESEDSPIYQAGRVSQNESENTPIYQAGRVSQNESENTPISQDDPRLSPTAIYGEFVQSASVFYDVSEKQMKPVEPIAKRGVPIDKDGDGNHDTIMGTDWAALY